VVKGKLQQQSKDNERWGAATSSDAKIVLLPAKISTIYPMEDFISQPQTKYISAPKLRSILLHSRLQS